MERKQLRRRRQEKLHLKSAFVLFQIPSVLFHLVQFVKCRRMFLDLNSNSPRSIYENFNMTPGF